MFGGLVQQLNTTNACLVDVLACHTSNKMRTLGGVQKRISWKQKVLQEWRVGGGAPTCF